jgi:hypothetical protein
VHSVAWASVRECHSKDVPEQGGAAVVSGQDSGMACARNFVRVRQQSLTQPAVPLAVLLTLCGCAGSQSASTQRPDRGGLHFVPTPPAFRAQCRSTARAVGYFVPCPMRVPPGFAANQDGAQADCKITIICPAERSGRARGGTIESAYMHHVVLIWTVGQHTYGLGFHNFSGLRPTLQLDKELAKHIKLARP